MTQQPAVGKPRWTWKIYVYAAVLLALIVTPLFLLFYDGETSFSDVEQETIDKQEKREQAELAAEVAEERADESHTPASASTNQSFQNVVLDGLGGAGVFITEWMDLLVLLMVLGFIISVFIRLSDIFK